MRRKFAAVKHSGVFISWWLLGWIAPWQLLLPTLLPDGAWLAQALSQEEPAQCDTTDVPLVRRLEDIPQDSYGRAGLAHMTIAGAVHHGMKEVEVWMQSFAPNAGTPIHRHDCEEIFVVLQGTGTVYTAATLGPDSRGTPGTPLATPILPNTTFTIPRNQVHRVWNTETEGTLQLLVVISRPPIHVYAYPSWDSPHETAEHRFPYPWDAVCPNQIGTSASKQEAVEELGAAKEDL